MADTLLTASDYIGAKAYFVSVLMDIDLIADIVSSSSDTYPLVLDKWLSAKDRGSLFG